MKPNHKCDPARMALLYIRQQFICTTFKFDAYKYDTKDHKHEGLNVYKLIKDGKLEMANAKVSYSKASSKDMLELIKETNRFWDVLFYQIDQIIKSNEMNLGVVDIQKVLKYNFNDNNKDKYKLYGSDADKKILYSKSYLERHYEYTWPNDPYDKYKQVKDVLLALENEVRSRRKEDREER